MIKSFQMVEYVRSAVALEGPEEMHEVLTGTLRLLLLAGVAILLADSLLWRYDAMPFGIVAAHMPFPEDGKVTNGVYVNDYFGLSLLLPEGWTEGEPGPEPSNFGYYVLSSLVPRAELNATILIAAQDMFFARGSHGDVAEVVHDFRQAMSEIDGMTIDREPTEVKIADRLLYRVDYSGVGLYRATFFTTAIRCHAVSFNLTARSPDLLGDLALSIDKLLVAEKPKTGVPPCIENYATPENVVRRVEPVAVGSRFTNVPVRLVIDRQGGVKQVHVIHASAEQRKSIEDAVRQWKFKPHRLNERAVEIETGLVFKLAAGT
jgi:Gram-negative bacterial TonB protein C-terminal